ncbi:hypothetical protein Tco_0033798 [Tanacetum coccineum]
MDEYVQFETEQALKNGKVYNWETTKYGKTNWCLDNVDIDVLRNIQGVCGALDGAVTPPDFQDMIELVIGIDNLGQQAVGVFSKYISLEIIISGPYGELDGDVSPPDELDTPKLVKLVEMGH